MNSVPRWIVVFFIVLSFAGFLDATYITVKHFQGGIIPCSLTEGCEPVLSSSYSKILGIPVSLIGVGYYLVVLLISIASLLHDQKIFRWAVYISFVGFVFSVWFTYVQIFKIHALCQYCLLSAVLTTLLCIGGLRVLQLRNESSHSLKSGS
ncbi:MAG: vitamin K epoxide reductase family protein [Patescibacteria group bacterium]